MDMVWIGALVVLGGAMAGAVALLGRLEPEQRGRP